MNYHDRTEWDRWTRYLINHNIASEISDFMMVAWRITPWGQGILTQIVHNRDMDADIQEYD
jgi:hypothetical protein